MNIFKKLNYLILVALLLWSISFNSLLVEGGAGISCNSCEDCNQKIQDASFGDTIFLENGIETVPGTCIDFRGKDGITFDCNNHAIDGDYDDDMYEYGFYLNQTGDGSRYNTIKNCEIYGFYDGINIDSSPYTTLINIISSYNADDGIQVSNSNTTILENIITNGNSYGVYLSGNPFGGYSNSLNLVKNITSKNNNNVGIYLAYAEDTKIYDAFVDGCGIILLDCVNNSLVNITSINNNGMFTCDGLELSNSNNNLIKNIILNNNYNGLYFVSSFKNKVINVTTNNNEDIGIDIYRSYENNISDAISKDNGEYGIRIYRNSFSNIIKDSKIIKNYDGNLYMGTFNGENPISNKIYNCIFNSSVSGDNAIITSEVEANSFNSTKVIGENIVGGNWIGGNYWGIYSDNCDDSDTNGICDDPYDVKNQQKCGSGSQTIKLIIPDIDTLEDTYVHPNSPDTNYGDSQQLWWNTNNGQVFTYIKFNLSKIPEDATILDAKLALNTGTWGSDYRFHIYALDNKNWVEEDPTYNNPVTGIGVKLDTVESSDNGYQIFAVTDWVVYQFESGGIRSVISFAHNASDVGFSGISHYWSKDGTPNNVKPYLNVTYTGASCSSNTDYLPLSKNDVNNIYCDSCVDCTQKINNANPGETIMLQNDILDYGDTCIIINEVTNGVIFDCQDNTIDANNPGSGDYGINIAGNNNIIKNCNVKEFYNGIVLSGSANNNIIRDSVIEENEKMDIYPVYPSGCNNNLINVYGSNNLPIEAYDSSVKISDRILSELILCDADNSVVDNVTIIGSKTKKNNGIFARTTDYSNFTNINSSNNERALAISASKHNIISNSIFNNNEVVGLELSTGANNMTVINLTVNSNDNMGIWIMQSEDIIVKGCKIENNNRGMAVLSSFADEHNLIYNNFFNNSNNIDFHPWGFYSDWNTGKTTGINVMGGFQIGGNYWSEPDTNGNYSDICEDVDSDGFCDYPYSVIDNKGVSPCGDVGDPPCANCDNGICQDLCDNGNHCDYFPLSKNSVPLVIYCDSCEDCSEKIRKANPGETIMLTKDLIDHDETCIYSNGSDHITFDCQGYTISKDKNAAEPPLVWGILLGGPFFENSVNFTVKNCNINNSGLFISYGGNNTIKNVVINKDHGLWIMTSDSNIVEDSIIKNTGVGLDISWNADNNIIRNVRMYNVSGNGIYIWGKNNNISNSLINSEYIFISSGGDTYDNLLYNNIFNISEEIRFGSNPDNNNWNIDKKSKTNIVGGNKIAGNYWTEPDSDGGFSDNCIDSDKDGFCELLYDVTRETGDNSCPATSHGNCDNFPLSNKFQIIDHQGRGPVTYTISFKSRLIKIMKSVL